MTDDLEERLLDENVTGFNLTIAAVEAAERIERLEAEVAEWKEKAKVWLASPEAAAQLDGYRELGAKVAALEAELATSRELKQIWQNRAYEAEKSLAAAQAKIDELMLEYCPEEMTLEQIAEWGRNQEAC